MNSCLVQLTDFILRGRAKDLYNGMKLVDLQKAFDMLDHKIECTGFKESFMKWF